MSESNQDQVEFECPHCHTEMTASAANAGEQITCKNCKNLIRVPSTTIGDDFDRLLHEFEKNNSQDAAPTGDLPAPANLDFEFEAPSLSELNALLQPAAKAESRPPQPAPRNPLLSKLDAPTSDDRTSEATSPPSPPNPSPNDRESFASMGKASSSLYEPLLPNAEDLAPLRVEGFEEVLAEKTSIATVCRICDTRIIVPASKLGQTIKCPECFTEFVVAERNRKLMSLDQPGNTGEAANENQPDGSEELKLADPEPIDKAMFGFESFTGINSDRDFANPERDFSEELGEELAPIAIPTRPTQAKESWLNLLPPEPVAASSEDELRLAPEELEEVEVIDELPTTPIPTPAPRSKEPKSDPTARTQSKVNEPSSAQAKGRKADPQTPPPASQTREESLIGRSQSSTQSSASTRPTSTYEARKSDYIDPRVIEQETNPLGMKLEKLGLPDASTFRWLKKMFSNVQLLARIGMAVASLTFAYWMFDFAWNAFQDEGGGSAVLWFVLAGIPGFLVFLATWGILFAIGGVLFEAGGDKSPTYSDWTNLTVAEYFPRFLFMGFGFWLASLPGLALGVVLMLATKNPMPLGITTTLAGMVFSPLLYLSAHYTGSPFNVMSKDIWSRVGSKNIDWARFLSVSGLTWGAMLVGILILIPNSIVFCFLGALIQIVAFLIFCSKIGLFAGLLSDKLPKTTPTS